MAHGLNSVIKRGVGAVQCRPEGKTGVGSRRIFSPQFKLQVLDSYRNDTDCKGNQRATARKYGIHRRQIQKWLQVENTLRSGKQQQTTQAVKSEVALNGHRQRDDIRSASSAGEARVPAVEPPAGWRPHQAPLCVPDPAAPMDLSLKRPVSPLSLPPAASVYVPMAGPTSDLPIQPDVWDLSTKTYKRKIENDCVSPVSPKPVKLFKPYLDDLTVKDGPKPPVPVKTTPSSPQPIYCCPPPHPCSPDIYYITNNNICCDVQASECHSGYTLHELQPTYCPFTYYNEYNTQLSPPYSSYEESPYSVSNSLKQRQSYSLDFKLSAIDCYYQDSLCKGNQRAVATKYNVHRRQVQKWLKQEEDLKSRNEALKHIHAVR